MPYDNTIAACTGLYRHTVCWIGVYSRSAFIHIHLEGYFSIHLSAMVPLDELIVYHSARETGEERDRERGREDGEDRGRRTEREDAVEDNIENSCCVLP